MLVGITALAEFAAAVPAGVLVERIGERRALVLAGVADAVGCALALAAPAGAHAPSTTDAVDAPRAAAPEPIPEAMGMVEAILISRSGRGETCARKKRLWIAAATGWSEESAFRTWCP